MTKDKNGKYKNKGWGMSLYIIYSITVLLGTANQDDSQRATYRQTIPFRRCFSHQKWKKSKWTPAPACVVLY